MQLDSIKSQLGFGCSGYRVIHMHQGNGINGEYHQVNALTSSYARPLSNPLLNRNHYSIKYPNRLMQENGLMRTLTISDWSGEWWNKLGHPDKVFILYICKSTLGIIKWKIPGSSCYVWRLILNFQRSLLKIQKLKPTDVHLCLYGLPGWQVCQLGQKVIPFKGQV